MAKLNEIRALHPSCSPRHEEKMVILFDEDEGTATTFWVDLLEVMEACGKVKPEFVKEVDGKEIGFIGLCG